MNRKITMSGVVIAAYITLIYLFQGLSFGPIQIRLANSLYGLCAIYPFLVLPLGVAVVMANLLFGGLGLIDIICGFCIAIITCYIVSKLGKTLMIILPIIFIPGLLVPIWLSILLKIPYLVMMPSVLIGQITPALLAIVLIKRL